MTFTLYIAGPMTGLPELNFPAFHAAEKQLLDHGYGVLNPAARAGQTTGQTWDWYLRRGIRDVTHADGIAYLPGWENSRGATLEIHIADALGLPRSPLPTWLEIAIRLGQ